MDNNRFRTAIWGARKIAKNFLESKVLHKDYEIICIVDNDPAKWGMTWCSYPVISPNKLGEKEIDLIIVCSNHYNDIKQQIIEDAGITIRAESILSIKQVEDRLVHKLSNMYKDSDDPEIRRIIDDYKMNGFSVFGYYRPDLRIRYDVYRDEDNWPYVIFESKRMYYPRNRIFATDSKGEYVENILYEQQPGSPHLYIKEEWPIHPGDVIVDAGVCEGNFALRYVEDAKMVYLIEADEEWCEALRRTFEPYKNKVVLCDKYLGGADSEQMITLDSLVDGMIDFLKMDIEGAEVDALLGASKVLRNSNARCAICSYHRRDDEKEIKKILSEYGYKTAESEGYMFFIYDDNISNTMDFRRGIVYGEKR